MTYIRRNISIPEEDNRLAEEKAKELGMSFSMLVRTAIRRLRVQNYGK